MKKKESMMTGKLTWTQNQKINKRMAGKNFCGLKEHQTAEMEKKLNCRERMNASTTFLAMSMFVLVKETASGCVLLEHAGSSTTRTPVVADKWFSVLSGVSTDYQRSVWLKQSVFRSKLDCQSPSGPVG